MLLVETSELNRRIPGAQRLAEATLRIPPVGNISSINKFLMNASGHNILAKSGLPKTGSGQIHRPVAVALAPTEVTERDIASTGIADECSRSTCPNSVVWPYLSASPHLPPPQMPRTLPQP